jgi:hypothetical protein
MMNKSFLLLLWSMLFSTWICSGMERKSRYEPTPDAEYERQLSNLSNHKLVGVYNDILQVMKDTKEVKNEKALLKLAPHTAVKNFLSSMNARFKEDFMPSSLDPVKRPYPDIKVMKQELAAIKQRIPQSPKYFTNVARYISSCALADKYFKMNDIPYDAWDAPNGNKMIMKLIELIAYKVIFLKLKNGKPRLIIHRPDRVQGGITQKLDPYKFGTSDFCELKKSIEQCIAIRFFDYFKITRNVVIPSAVSVFKNLQEVDICYAKNISSQVFDLPLTKLRIEHSPEAMSVIRADLAKCTGLTCLNLESNTLKSMPESISKLTKLTELDLGCNKLIRIPHDMSSLTNLTRLDLVYNKLTCIPTEISALTNLTKLDLPSNKLTSIPTEISTLTNLTELDIYFNKLKYIPDEVSALTNLNTIDLAMNRVESIPEDISKLARLTKLDFSHNSLKVVLPRSMTRMIQLKELEIKGKNRSIQSWHQRHPELFSGA